MARRFWAAGRGGGGGGRKLVLDNKQTNNSVEGAKETPKMLVNSLCKNKNLGKKAKGNIDETL